MKAMLSEREKVYILINYNHKSLGKLSQDLNRSRHTIYSFYKKWQATGTISSLKMMCGRRKMIDAATEKKIEDYVERHPRTTLKKYKIL